MSITIKNNTVFVPRNLKDATLPWNKDMLALAEKAKRQDSLGVFSYTFNEYKDAASFYTNLLTKPNKR